LPLLRAALHRLQQPQQQQPPQPRPLAGNSICNRDRLEAVLLLFRLHLLITIITICIQQLPVSLVFAFNCKTEKRDIDDVNLSIQMDTIAAAMANLRELYASVPGAGLAIPSPLHPHHHPHHQQRILDLSRYSSTLARPTSYHDLAGHHQHLLAAAAAAAAAAAQGNHHHHHHHPGAPGGV